MKKLLLLAVVALAGCAGVNEHGECVGFGKQQPGKVYELSTRNAVCTAIFAGGIGIVVPVVWALKYAYCPTGELSK